MEMKSYCCIHFKKKIKIKKYAHAKWGMYMGDTTPPGPPSQKSPHILTTESKVCLH